MVVVLNFIGKGTLTTVYSGTSRLTTKEVVVKVLNRDLLADNKTVKRFVKGAQQSLKLIHPNIAQTFAVQNVKRGSEPYVTPCLVTEKVNGPNLNQLLIERKILEPYVVASIVIDVCSALQYAMSEGVEHHDLKPSNIYLSLDQKGMVPKLVDFGLAERLFRNLEWSAPPLPDGRTASIYGDPSCTSPESAFQGILSIESEIYSLGCIMYAAVSGDNPFIGNNHFDTLMQHRGKMPPPLDKLTVAANMEKIIFKCLEKDPQDRYHSLDELKEALQHFMREPSEKS
jgi:serine/threonine-protein kinase